MKKRCECLSIPESEFFEEAKKAKEKCLSNESDEIMTAEEFFAESDDDRDVDESEEAMSIEEFFAEADDDSLNESQEPEDVITVADFIGLLNKRCKPDDKIEFRSNKKTSQLLADVTSKGGITVVELTDSHRMRESTEPLLKWQPVDKVEPKAKGRLIGWKCGPSSKDLVDLLYPERKYIDGIPMLRNKYVKAGSMSGEICIAVPSYFDAIKHNDKDAIMLLTALKIPLNLTLGLDPDGDYSFDYDIC